ncbi:kinesin-like protein KIF12 isoform X2 [Nematostella vectensis]|uniref:kinesin-like protein KIF12 isoform X2 n=1 Tax=Nematostella vectensis TaxID=45351 RepID=UPI00139047B8|nr:kinesin-like protein KIF12 isoform X2 [Nematostella vectensis]
MAESHDVYKSTNSAATTSGEDMKTESSTTLYSESSSVDERSPSDSDSPRNTPPSRSQASETSSSRPSSFHSGLSSRSTTESELEGHGADNIRVVVRVRPLNSSEKEKASKNIIKLPGDGAIWIDNSFGQIKPFTFNVVLAENTSQAEMFEECGIKHLVNMALEGYSCTAFAFGQTGSGKTFTITGPLDGQYQEGALPTPEMQGLIERSFQYMFHEMERKSERISYTLRASYLEVYNERVKDLLNPSSAHDSLPVRWSRNRGFYVENLFFVECDNMDDLMAVLEEGLRYRQVGSHMMNDHSSRSHTLLTVYIDIELCDPDDESGFSIQRHGKLSFVDLAGSERVKETKSVGGTFAESQNINKSLLTLGNCISALSDQKKRAGHIPYRDSKLTKLLADSLGGDGVTLMIACISPSSSVVSDTLNTLRYANRAKKIKNKPVVQMDPKERLIMTLKREIKLLRTENNYFRQQLGLPSSESQTTIASDSSKESTDENSNKVLLKPGSPVQRQPTKIESLLLIDNERKRLTTASLTAGANSGLYDMLQEYMMENELLRTENSDLHKSREEVSRQRLLVSRENDRLVKKLEDLERVFSSSPSFERRSGVSEGSVPSHDNHRSNSHPDPSHSARTMRANSEPRGVPLRFPPLSNGPYPNYVNETWPPTRNNNDLSDVSDAPYSAHARSLPENRREHTNRQPISKSSPAKLQKTAPSSISKPSGGYASLYSKNKEKEKRTKKQSRPSEEHPASTQIVQPAPTGHAQKAYGYASMMTYASPQSYQTPAGYSHGYSEQIQSGVPEANVNLYQPPVAGNYSHGYSGQRQPGVPEMNMNAYYLHSQTQAWLNKDRGSDSLDPRVNHHQHTSHNQHQNSPNR